MKQEERMTPTDRISWLEAEHRALDERLKELCRHPHLTPSEEAEAKTIKKLKLRAKDEIYSLRGA